MKRSLSLVCCTLLVAGLAAAEKVPGMDGGSIYVSGSECTNDGYKSFVGDGGGEIADNDPAGLRLVGPTVTDDSTIITDVIVDITMAHTWVGDLTVDVSYDLECDGQSETTVRLVCRPGQATCDASGSTFGCSDDVDGTYRFSDEGAVTLGENCVGTQAAGCYGPSGDASAPSTLSDFDNNPKGGCFSLLVVDNANGDTGSVSSWAVWTENDGGSPVEAVSWSQVKARF